jgi:signal transduction histidine kinase
VQQGLLEVFANQAGIAINGARQRWALAEQVRLASAVQQVARTSQRELEPARAVDAVVDPILEGLNCSALWIRVLASDEDGPADSVVSHSGQRSHSPPTDLVELANRIAQQCWQDHIVGFIREQVAHPQGLLNDQEVARVLAVIAPAGSMMLAPIGSGRDCLGHVVMTRDAPALAWSDAEAAAALEMGRDLGRSIVNARLLALERRVATQLRQADRAKTSLFSTVSHELKNPLASIVGHLELLREDPAADPAWSLGVMERNTHRLQTLVDDLLTLARVSDPDRPLKRSRVDLAELTQDAVDMFTPQAAQLGVALSNQLVQGDAVVSGSPDELGRVVENLVSNAVKFSPDHGAVTLRTQRHHDTVELVCADEGLGISEQDQLRLFTEFFRSTNPAALDVPGTGLGLTIVGRIVSRHGGNISVESTLGRGTTFRVVLPAA